MNFETDQWHRLSLPVQAPFNLEVTVRLLQRRPTNRIDHWENDHYLRAVETSDGLRLVAVSNAGTIDQPDLRADIAGGAISLPIEQQIRDTVRMILGLDAEPAPVDWLAGQEPRIAPLTQALRGFRAPCFPSLFETSGLVIPYQQLSLDAGTAIIGRVVDRFGSTINVDGRVWSTYPTPQTMIDASTDELRAAGLSRSKITATKKLAALTLEGRLDGRDYAALPTATALKQLIALPGIGPWTAGLMLLRGLRRMDVFPPGDVGVARNLTSMLELETPLTTADTVEFSEKFGDCRGYLYFLSLGSQLLSRNLITPAHKP